MAKPRPIQRVEGTALGRIYACPYCHRFVVRARGLRQCYVCGGWVDNDRVEQCPDNVEVKQKGVISWRLQ